MRTYGKVSPRIWTGRFGKAIRGDLAAQVLAAYLLTCSHSNLIGLFHLPLAYVVADTGLSLGKVKSSLRRFEKLGFAHYDFDTERVWIVEHTRHEFAGLAVKPSDKRVTAVKTTLLDNAVSPLAGAFAEHYAELHEMCGSPMEGASMPPASPIEGPSEPLRSQEQEQEQDQDQHQDPAGAKEHRSGEDDCSGELAAFDPPFTDPEFLDALASWVKSRREIRKPLRSDSEAWRLQRMSIVEAGRDASIRALLKSAGAGWQSLNFAPERANSAPRSGDYSAVELEAMTD